MIKHIFLPKLHSWYGVHKRDLPFRHTSNPYKIWLSEIILQQTRVNQGLPYYYKFLELFPTVHDLANAEEDTVLNAWQGLGYYSRARNLHYSAKYVVNELKGVFPTSYNQLIQLKGVGDYTASAIASFSSKEVVPVLDGNVYRFMSRFYGIETPINTPKAVKEFKQVLFELIDEKDPDLFNQAMIEFGALHCTPTSPDCASCPFNESCYARSKNEVGQFPVKLKKKKSVERHLSFYLIRNEGKIFIYKREAKSIWQNLYEFPFHESKECFDKEELADSFTSELSVNQVSKSIKHMLSHQNIYAKLFECEATAKFKPSENWLLISPQELSNYPIHRLMEKLIDTTSLFN